MPPSIVPASPQDIIRITAIIRAAFGVVARRFDLTPENCPKHPSNCTEHWVARDLARGVRYYLARQDRQVVGCVGVERASAETCYLERLAVLPDHQRRGVGAALVSHGLDRAHHLGAKEVGVAIIAAQTELARWYQHLGFTPAGTRRFDHLPFEVAFLKWGTS
ncbi:MAG: GNAT family N-acetyltransferase [Desulfosarcinaceae bacterium]|jgi:predicted N-acetyltransferase YhbS